MVKISKYFIPYIIFLVYIGYNGQLVYSFFIVIFHEFIHYAFAKFYGFSGFDIELIGVGASIKLKDLDEASPKQDLIISASGPMANLILCIIFYFLYKNFQYNELYMLFKGNLSIGLFNLIPAFPLDGGRILRDILNFRFIYKRANKIMISVSIIIAILLMFLYILLFLEGHNNFNIGIIGLFIIVSSLRENERIAYIIMGDIVRKRHKFIKRGHIENKNTSIYYKMNLLSAVSLFDKNKYNVFTVLDEELKVMDIVYEEEILIALKQYGNITIEEFMKIENIETK
ncbi:M50 family metallopeptidase [Clostridium sp. DJ247]|uniref:M50 family metallopeptidase n=1 Tax=Clostridium sp. DJ247 TaxID=2726188 RepID=UPI001626E0AE|nr:M50 family metallopeptidase [Clostridium sp. DJ247]MBC2580630.1 metalloprotease [Clostridium sp. DJ247]